MISIKYLAIAISFLFLLATNIVRADTALYNVNGYTSTNDGLKTFSVLVFNDSGQIVATGNEELLTAYPQLTLIDGHRETVLPGITDAHGHVYGMGLLKASLDLMGTPTVADGVAQIADYAADRSRASTTTHWSLKSMTSR
jgi:predicted amidohydrolase YtcJ